MCIDSPECQFEIAARGRAATVAFWIFASQRERNRLISLFEEFNCSTSGITNLWPGGGTVLLEIKKHISCAVGATRSLLSGAS